jgi:hypothetical protein
MSHQDFTDECKRLSESCLYTATSLHMWLRYLRGWQMAFTVIPLVLGTIAGWSVLSEVQDPLVQGVVGFLALLAGLLPSIYNGIKLDGKIEEAKGLAAEFSNLRDRFKQASFTAGEKNPVEFQAEFQPLMERLEKARCASLTPPEWAFQSARKKVKAGHYDPDEQTH